MRQITLIIAALLVISPFTVHATLIDFDGYVDTTNLHGVNLGGVTLTGNAGLVEVFANDRFGASFNSPLNSVSTLGDFVLHGAFDFASSFVSLWAGDNGGDIDSWTLEAFDAGNNSLGFLASGDFDGNPYSQLSITAAGIMSFEARWTGVEAGIAWDDLEFSASVPEPGTMALLSLGLFGLGFNRRKRD